MQKIIRPLSAIALFAMVLGWCASALAQAGGGAIEPAHTWVIAVGVGNNFSGRYTPLPYADKGARKIADALKNANPKTTDCYVLTADSKLDPTALSIRSNVIGKFDEVRSQAGKNDLVVFYLCGHGLQENGGQYYLMADADIDTPGSYEGCIPLSEIMQRLSTINCRAQLLILDACQETRESIRQSNSVAQSEVWTAGTHQAVQAYIDRNQATAGKPAVAALFGCSANERTYYDDRRQSIFSEAVVNGLTGNARDTGSRKVTFNTLSNYVVSAVGRSKDGSVQHPYRECPTTFDILLCPPPPMIALPAFHNDPNKTISDRFYNTLINADAFSLVERTHIDSILSEKRFIQSGGLSDAANAREIGELVSAQYVVVGSIGALGNQQQLSVSLVDVKTGEVCPGVSAICEYNPDGDIGRQIDQASQAFCENTAHFLHVPLLTMPQRNYGTITMPTATPALAKDSLKLIPNDSFYPECAALYSGDTHDQAAGALAQCRLTNTCSYEMTDIDICYRVNDEKWGEPSHYDSLRPGKSLTDAYYPTHIQSLSALEPGQPVTVAAHVSYVDVDGRTQTLSTLATLTPADIRHIAPMYTAEQQAHAPLLGAFLTSNDDAVLKFTDLVRRQAANDVSMPEAGPLTTAEQAHAFCQALLQLAWFYHLTCTPYTTISAQPNDWQQVKLPRDTLHDHGGSYLDVAVLFASVCDAAGLPTSIVLAPGNAYPLVTYPDGTPYAVPIALLAQSKDTDAVSYTWQDLDSHWNNALSQGLRVGAQPDPDAKEYKLAELRQKGIAPITCPPASTDILNAWNYSTLPQRPLPIVADDLHLTINPRLYPQLLSLYGNRSLDDGAWWLAKFKLTYIKPEAISNVSIRYRIDGVTDWSQPIRCHNLTSGQTLEDQFYPSFSDGSQIVAPGQTLSVSVAFSYTDIKGRNHLVTSSAQATGEDISSLSAPLRGDEHGMTTLLAAWVTEDDAPVKVFARLARTTAHQISGIPLDGPLTTARDIRAFCKALIQTGMFNHLAIAPRDKNPEKANLKRSRDVLRDHNGSELDIALLFVGACRAEGINTDLFLGQDKALPVVYLPGGARMTLPTHMLATPLPNADAATVQFWKALEDNWQAAETHSDQSNDPNMRLIDITALRQSGIRSLLLPEAGTDIMASYRAIPPPAWQINPQDMSFETRAVFLPQAAQDYGSQLLSGGWWFARFHCRNASGDPVTDLQISYRIRSVTDWSTPHRYAKLDAGAGITDLYYPDFSQNLPSVPAGCPLTVEVQCLYTDSFGLQHTEQLYDQSICRDFANINPYTETHPENLLLSIAPLLPSYLNSDDAWATSYAKLVYRQLNRCYADQKKKERCEPGKPFASDQQAIDFCNEAIVLAYYNGIACITPETIAQKPKGWGHVRLPEEVLEKRHGSYLDLAILLADTCMAAGLPTSLMIDHDTVYPVVVLPGGGQYALPTNLLLDASGALLGKNALAVASKIDAFREAVRTAAAKCPCKTDTQAGVYTLDAAQCGHITVSITITDTAQPASVPALKLELTPSVSDIDPRKWVL